MFSAVLQLLLQTRILFARRNQFIACFGRSCCRLLLNLGLQGRFRFPRRRLGLGRWLLVLNRNGCRLLLFSHLHDRRRSNAIQLLANADLLAVAGLLGLQLSRIARLLGQLVPLFLMFANNLRRLAGRDSLNLCRLRRLQMTARLEQVDVVHVEFVAVLLKQSHHDLFARITGVGSQTACDRIKRITAHDRAVVSRARPIVETLDGRSSRRLSHLNHWLLDLSHGCRLGGRFPDRLGLLKKYRIFLEMRHPPFLGLQDQIEIGSL